MTKGILTTISIFTIGLLVAISGFFLLEIEQIALNFWAFGSLILSFIVSLVVTLIVIKQNNNTDRLFYTSGLNSAIWVYEILIVISLFFTNSFKGHLGSFILLQIGINALFLIATIVIINISGRLNNINVQTYEKIQRGEYSKPKRGRF